MWDHEGSLGVRSRFSQVYGCTDRLSRVSRSFSLAPPLKLRVQQMIEAEQAWEREERAKQREVARARRRSITNDWMVVFSFIAVLFAVAASSGISPED